MKTKCGAAVIAALLFWIRCRWLSVAATTTTTTTTTSSSSQSSSRSSSSSSSPPRPLIGAGIASTGRSGPALIGTASTTPRTRTFENGGGEKKIVAVVIGGGAIGKNGGGRVGGKLGLFFGNGDGGNRVGTSFLSFRSVGDRVDCPSAPSYRYGGTLLSSSLNMIWRFRRGKKEGDDDYDGYDDADSGSATSTQSEQQMQQQQDQSNQLTPIQRMRSSGDGSPTLRIRDFFRRVTDAAAQQGEEERQEEGGGKVLYGYKGTNEEASLPAAAPLQQYTYRDDVNYFRRVDAVNERVSGGESDESSSSPADATDNDGDDDENDENNKFDFVQRIESVKCLIVGAVVASVAVAPLTILHDLILFDAVTPGLVASSSSSDAATAAAVVGISKLGQFEFDTDMAAVQGGLFAIVYRYAVRGDTDKEQLKEGVSGAFAITRATSRIHIPGYCTALPLQCGPPFQYLDWNLLAQFVVNGAEAFALFTVTAAALDYCFEKGFISKFSS